MKIQLVSVIGPMVNIVVLDDLGQTEHICKAVEDEGGTPELSKMSNLDTSSLIVVSKAYWAGSQGKLMSQQNVKLLHRGQPIVSSQPNFLLTMTEFKNLNHVYIVIKNWANSVF